MTSTRSNSAKMISERKPNKQKAVQKIAELLHRRIIEEERLLRVERLIEISMSCGKCGKCGDSTLGLN